MESEANNILRIEIILLSDPPIVNRICNDFDKNEVNCLKNGKNTVGDECWREAVLKQLNSIISRVSLIEGTRLELFMLNNKDQVKENIYYEDEGICRFVGHLKCEQMNKKSVQKILINLCSEEKLSRCWISLANDEFDTYFKMERLITYQELRPKSFQFGTIIDLSHFIMHYDSSSSGKIVKNPNFNNAGCVLRVAKDDIQVDFHHDKKVFVLKFRITSGAKNHRMFTNYRYKLNYKYSSINSVVVYAEKGVIKMCFNLKHPPTLYKYEPDARQMDSRTSRLTFKNITQDILSHTVHNDDVTDSQYWLRETEFDGITTEIIGKCNVLRFQVPTIIDEEREKMQKFSFQYPDPWRILAGIKQFAKVPIYFSHIKQQSAKIQKVFRLQYGGSHLLKGLPFAVHYSYLSIFSHSFQAADDLTFERKEGVSDDKNFVESIKEFAKMDEKSLELALFDISAALDRGSFVRVLNALQVLFYRKYGLIRKVDINSFNIEVEEIRRCILTPSRLLMLPPEPTLKSRFICNSDPDFAIRLSLREDNLQLLGFSLRSGSRRAQLDFLQKSIKEPLERGIAIGDRVYEFLGGSSSQLRDNGMILYSRDNEGRTAKSIRDSMGDMTKIKRNVPKFVARLGLAFSQALTHIKITNDTRIDVIPDIKGTLKPCFYDTKLMTTERYVFSDGIGMISQRLFQEVYNKLPNECVNEPSAMQIRFGGCKGMLVLNPKLSGKHIVFRESMKKYDSNDRTLAVLKLSAPRPVYLNRPLITILEQLGVKRQVFLRMLIQNLKNLANALLCECSAFPLIQNHSNLHIPYKKIMLSGIPFLCEPVFRQMVDSLIRYNVNELKLKARIKVPMNQGRILFGVLDETQTLQYGQIFVQISNINPDKPSICTILKGEIMVTKYPCMHPGDVRKLECIDIPELHHIKDCIVFPAKGKRPHPDEMAGSDLDGDEFSIFWNTELVFAGENHSAMHFSSGKLRELDHDAKVGDILDFYCSYILYNNVGLIANAHLAIADLYRDGIFGEMCQNLATKYAIALDFAKTGKIKPLLWNEHPLMYPDFMEKYAEKRTYLSKKVLGKIYRHCCRFEMSLNDKQDLQISFQPNPAFELNGWQMYEESATKAFNLYKEKISYLLTRFGIESESALLSGAYDKTSKHITGRTETNDTHELLETLVNDTFRELKETFEFQCQGCTVKQQNLRASAWYMVTYKLNVNPSQAYFGFPWTVTDYLCQIVPLRKDTNEYPHNCVLRAANVLDQYLINHHLNQNYSHLPGVLEAREKAAMASLETAKYVLLSWLSVQKKIFMNRETLSQHNHKSDIEEELKKVIKTFTQRILYDSFNTQKELPTAGTIVMLILKHLVDEWLSENTFLEDENEVIDGAKDKLGFLALMSLHCFFKTRQVCHILNINSSFHVSVPVTITESTFYIPLNNKEFSYFVTRRNEEFIEMLKQLSGVQDIRCQSYRHILQFNRTRYYYLVTAIGTLWSLGVLRKIIAHPSFYKDVVKKTLKDTILSPTKKSSVYSLLNSNGFLSLN